MGETAAGYLSWPLLRQAGIRPSKDSLSHRMSDGG